MPKTLPRLKKRTTNIELNGREIAILQLAVFRATVDVLQELNDYTRRNANGTQFQREATEEHTLLKAIESKLQHATSTTH